MGDSYINLSRCMLKENVYPQYREAITADKIKTAAQFLKNDGCFWLDSGWFSGYETDEVGFESSGMVSYVTAGSGPYVDIKSTEELQDRYAYRSPTTGGLGEKILLSLSLVPLAGMGAVGGAFIGLVWVSIFHPLSPEGEPLNMHTVSLFCGFLGILLFSVFGAFIISQDNKDQRARDQSARDWAIKRGACLMGEHCECVDKPFHPTIGYKRISAMAPNSQRLADRPS